jgi:hypothetical protein
VLTPSEANDFVLPTPTEAEASCFPPATSAEIAAALRQALRGYGMQNAEHERWLQLAASVAVPGDAPSYIAVSKVRLRIETRNAKGWSETTTIEFIPPMGC